MDILQGLDDIDWATLVHAYGSAADVPAQIRDLVSGDAERAKAALSAFGGNIYHQGTVYPATVEAVPFLIRAIDRVKGDNKEWLLYLIAEIAVGHGYYDVHQHLSLTQSIIEDEDPEEFARALATERSTVEKTTLAVFAGWDTFETLMESDRESLRLVALRLLTNLAMSDASNKSGPDEPARYLGVRPEGSVHGEWAARLVNRIQNANRDVLTPMEQASQIEVLRLLAQWDHPLLSEQRIANVSPLEAFILVYANAQIVLRTADYLPSRFADYLLAIVTHSEQIAGLIDSEAWPWDRDADEDVLALYQYFKPEDIDRVAPQIASLLRTSDRMLYRYSDILRIILGQDRPNIPDDPCTLSSGQRAVAAAFLDAPKDPADTWWFWTKENGNASNVAAEFGVPRDRWVWQQWLGLPRDGGPDKPPNDKPPKDKPSWKKKLFGG